MIIYPFINYTIVKRRNKFIVRNHKLKLSLLVILILQFAQPSQSFSSILNGFGLEFGVGKNNLFWSAPFNIKTIGGTPKDRTGWSLAYNIRLNKHTQLTQATLLLPFVGYNQIGGESEIDKYSIEILEVGSFFLLNVYNFAFGIGGKYNLHLNAHYDHQSTNTKDRSEWFSDNSIDIGLRTNYSIKHLIIGAETWFGLNNLASGPLTGATVKQNYIRLIVGIKI
jgi:hypothetical protein